MDRRQFDEFTRLFAAAASRRQALRAFAALSAIGLWPHRARAQWDNVCPDWLTFCPDSGTCVDLLSDLDNCGACGSVCASGLVAVTCQDGECVRDLDTDCPPGLEFCGPVIGCVDLQSDMDNCGACGSVCESGLVAVTCSWGECVRAY